jgi:hypothetical protein
MALESRPSASGGRTTHTSGGALEEGSPVTELLRGTGRCSLERVTSARGHVGPCNAGIFAAYVLR